MENQPCTRRPRARFTRRCAIGRGGNPKYIRGVCIQIITKRERRGQPSQAAGVRLAALAMAKFVVPAAAAAVLQLGGWEHLRSKLTCARRAVNSCARGIDSLRAKLSSGVASSYACDRDRSAVPCLRIRSVPSSAHVQRTAAFFASIWPLQDATVWTRRS